MPGGEARSNYIALPSEAPGQLYLEEEDGPFISRKPPVCESQILCSFAQVRLTPSRSRKSPVPLGMYRRNMLLRPLDGSLPHGFIPGESSTEILPNYGPPKTDQHLPEP